MKRDLKETSATPQSGDRSPSPGDRLPVDVRDLLAGQRSVALIHAGQQYRLSVTRNGKLILTK